MIYYILLPGDTEDDTVNSSNILGEVTFKKFYPNDGFDVLSNILDKRPELLELLRIYDNTGKKYTVESFLSIIEKHATKTKRR